MQNRREVFELLASTVDAYHRCIKTGNDLWRDKHAEMLKQVTMDHMPSGAGFDNGTRMDLGRSTDTKLVFRTAFHHMDDNGSYDGWTDHVITVTPSFGHGMDIKISGENRNQIKDHTADVFRFALETEVIWNDLAERWVSTLY